MNQPNTYWKALVIDLDPYCESKIVLDKNCSYKEFDSVLEEINSYTDIRYYKTMIEMPALQIM